MKNSPQNTYRYRYRYSRRIFRELTLGSAITLLMSSALAESPKEAVDSDKVSEDKQITVYVYGERGETNSSTKLDLSIFETPQSISVVSQAQMHDFALNDVNQLLRTVPGVTVESVETDRTYYTARGFDIVNFQYDGVGMPFFYGLTQGQQDTAIYERVEIAKGAAGLVTGLANPSATINYIRKRPTTDLQASAGLTVGEWNKVRLDGDLSGSITSNVQARLVVASEQADSYLDRYSDKLNIAYGVVDVQLAPSTQLTVGHSYNDSRADGNLWGALPLYYTDGTQTDYPISTNTAPEWTFWDVKRSQTFVEFSQQLGTQWELKGIYTQNDIDQDSRLFYVRNSPDSETELGLRGMPSLYIADEQQKTVDAFISGSFASFGREHQLVAGVNLARVYTNGKSFYKDGDRYLTLDGAWARGLTPRPPSLTSHNPSSDKADVDQEQDSIYFASRLNVTDRLSVLVGARNVEFEQEGVNYGTPSFASESQTVPYTGATYNLTDTVAAYASYSEVFVPQVWVDANSQLIGATEGENSEVGIKREFNDGLATATLAVFHVNHKNLGEYAGYNADKGFSFYEGKDYKSRGFEVEVAGEVAESLNVSFGFTQLDIENLEGEKARTYVPTQLLKLATSYRLPGLPAWKVGGSINWQDDIYIEPIEDVRVTQGSYALIDLFVRYEINSNLIAGLNVGNLTDKKYLNSLKWSQGYYAMPRNAQASLTWTY